MMRSGPDICPPPGHLALRHVSSFPPKTITAQICQTASWLGLVFRVVELECRVRVKYGADAGNGDFLGAGVRVGGR